MDSKILQIERESLIIDLEELLSYLPGTEADIDNHTHELASTLIGECREIMEPKGAYISMEAIQAADRDEIAIPGVGFRTGKTIVKMVQGAEQYFFFMVTAGSGPEELARSLMSEGQYLEGYIVDLIGSVIAEAATQHVHDHIKEICSQSGLIITNRYSPGYCGWNVDEQQKLFGLFPENSCGITLSDSSLMSPIKSVSGMFGAGPNVSFRDYTCELCSMKDCTFRRTRASHGSLS
ncbi:MAG: methionine synthase [Bacteroidetes bacterium]|nr:methionine synthase [Bacteroidota bacterium]